MSETFKLRGKIIVIEDTVQISGSFKKREFVIEVVNERNIEWNDFIKFQATQDKCDVLNGYNVGEDIEVSFNVRGRKWEKEGKTNYFSNLEAWNFEKVNSSGNNQMPEAPTSPSEPGDDSGDLPF